MEVLRKLCLEDARTRWVARGLLRGCVQIGLHMVPSVLLPHSSRLHSGCTVGTVSSAVVSESLKVSELSH